MSYRANTSITRKLIQTVQRKKKVIKLYNKMRRHMEFVSVRRAIKNGSMRKKILNESEKLNDQFLEKQKIIFERYRKIQEMF